jgi:hypothetical protein
MSSHSAASRSVGSKSHSSAFNSDPEDKGFVIEQKSASSRADSKAKDKAADIDLNFETRDIPFQIKTERAYESLKQEYRKAKDKD